MKLANYINIGCYILKPSNNTSICVPNMLHRGECAQPQAVVCSFF
jgi:hypothetical protein